MNMKICVTSTGTTLESAVDPRFGRAKYFIEYDTDTGTMTAHDNAINLNAVQGAGIQSAKQCSDFGVSAVVTGNVGPKAFAVLETANIAVYTGASGKVSDAVHAFRDGTLAKTGKANVEGHWGSM